MVKTVTLAKVSKTLDHIIENMATKDDLARIVEHMATKEDLAELRSELKGELATTRQELKAEIDDTRVELRSKIDGINRRLDSEAMARQDQKLPERVASIEAHLGIER